MVRHCVAFVSVVHGLGARPVTAAMQFASDNWAGATQAVRAALDEAADGFAPAYGDDDRTARVSGLFGQVFEREVAVLFVATGTAANLLCLEAAARPGGFVLCAEQAHLQVDEHNGAESATGMKLVPVPAPDGRITPAALRATLGRAPLAGREGRVAVLTLTNATELGTVYSPAEVAALAAIGHDLGAAVHVDGARLANAVAATGGSLADLTWRAGVDLVSFGGTKNGCWSAEAVVVLDPAAYPHAAALRQRAGHGLSKQRFVSAQFEAVLSDGEWLRTAAHANAMAARLLSGLLASPDVAFDWLPEPGSLANMVFPVLPSATAARMRAAGATFHTEDERGDAEQVRLVTSFATTAEDVERFLSLLEVPTRRG